MTNPTINQLKIGDKAPNFTVNSHPEASISLNSYLNKKNVILAFYPKDDTPGCTKEMCSFSENLLAFEAKDTEVLGISLDNVDSHSKFAQKYNLNQKLLADENGSIAKLFGVLPEGKNTANRVLFIIDKTGTILNIIEGMPNTQEILDMLESHK